MVSDMVFQSRSCTFALEEYLGAGNRSGFEKTDAAPQASYSVTGSEPKPLPCSAGRSGRLEGEQTLPRQS